ncbi:tetraprenyl-beta-curcumene synthase family protein [Virgibacillus sediminis]|uniref:Tetraprenyl-beta-curcumene synthase family protein n=1 Tax=Virgibacillus sediminis TaxID=202260 RepID=A0ABV7A225_9BACI
MAKHIPTRAVTLMKSVYQQVFPAVDKELSYWRKRAEEIPDRELRNQALSSMEAKRFHCQGGAVYSLLAGAKHVEAVRFIVAYQTISDYLDNLCDRSTSMNPEDFCLLHEAMSDALKPGTKTKNYYLLREEQDDGGYLAELVRTCQESLGMLDNYQMVEGHLLELQGLYADLQVHKHVRKEERMPRLTSWYKGYEAKFPDLDWHEFAASAGSTLGIFCLISYGLSGNLNETMAKDIIHGYFPYIQGIHILLDYFIDQQEDQEEGDLNFCNYYENYSRMRERFLYFIQQAEDRGRRLPDPGFHQMVVEGLVGLYLGDPKVNGLQYGPEMKRKLVKRGWRSRFFHLNTKLYYQLNGGRG